MSCTNTKSSVDFHVIGLLESQDPLWSDLLMADTIGEYTPIQSASIPSMALSCAPFIERWFNWNANLVLYPIVLKNVTFGT